MTIVPPSEGGLHSIRHGGGGADTRMVCGYLGCDSADGDPVLASLPAVIGRALGLLHSEVARAWSVEELSREAGVSRSALSERSSRRIGMAPMHYLAHWRMQVASLELKETAASMAQVAALVGCESEAAFSRAFKKATGIAPATWRRENR
jgi:AraC-like DNA-binding protein